MCDPLSLSIAATVVGTGLQYKAQQDREEEMTNFNRAENDRQERFNKESTALFEKNREEFSRDNADTNMAEAATARQQQYAAADRNAPRANDAPPGATGGNNVVLEAFQRAAAGAQQRAQQQGAARAELASFGDFMGDAAITTGRRSGDIGMLGSFMRGSADALGMELQRAATRQRGAATIGNLLTQLGSAGMGYAGGAGPLGMLSKAKSANAAIGMSAPATARGINLFSGLA